MDDELLEALASIGGLEGKSEEQLKEQVEFMMSELPPVYGL
jgi:hypothetical protein